MTDNEIIKVLTQYAGTYANYGVKQVAQEALSLINRQQAKIKALQMDNQQLQSDIVNANMNADHAQADIERLEDLLKRHKRHTDRIRLITAETAKKIKAEAIKEFAERLHCHCEAVINQEWNKKVSPVSWADAYEEFEEEIDNLLKEMVGDGG